MMKAIATTFAVGVGIALAAVPGRATAAQSVHCSTCAGPCCSDNCSFNGQTGSWGDSYTDGNGTQWHVCILGADTGGGLPHAGSVYSEAVLANDGGSTSIGPKGTVHRLEPMPL